VSPMLRVLAALLLAIVALPLEARELRIGLSQYPSTFNLLTEASVAQSYVNGMTRRPITAYDQDWKLICMLCVEVPSLDNGLAKLETTPTGEQGIAVTYKLQPNATWGDGTPVTSADMVFTWEVGKSPLSGTVGGEAFRRILAIDVIDDKTFTIHQDRVEFTYAAMGVELLPAHVEKPLFDSDPATWKERTAFDADPTNPGLYFGPYRIVQVTPGSEIVLEPNPTWYGAKPAFERIRLVIVPNTATLEANLLSGAIDMIAGELGLQIDQALSFQRRHGDDYQMLFIAGLFWEHIDLMLDSPRVGDVRVRQALLYALDREKLSQQLFAGQQPVATSFVSPLSKYFAENLPSYGYDPERAKQLLEEAGWTPGPDGIRVNTKGERLSLSYITTAGDRTRELVQQVLQAQWKAVGIEARIENQPSRVLFGQTLDERLFADMAQFGWIASPETSSRTIYASTEIPTKENGRQGQNYSGYNNPEMDKLLDAFERELDFEKRQAISAKMQKLFLADLPELPLYWRANTYVLPKWLQGVRPTGHLGPSTLWVEEWRDEE
jgi:peptide/nickel transport system substrate-binding protein